METGRSWHRRVLGLAVPITLANLTQPLLAIVSTAAAGHLPDAAALGGIALGNLFFNLLYWSLGFLRMGTTALTAHAQGARDEPLASVHLVRALLVAVALGVLIYIAREPLFELAVMALGGSAAVGDAAEAYVEARVVTAPLALTNLVLLGYLIGRQRVIPALLLQIFINGVNVVLVVVTVKYLGWGLRGIGWSTALAELAGCAAGVVLIWRQIRSEHLRWAEIIDPARLRELLFLNADILIRTLLLLSTTLWFARAGASQSDVIFAANTLLLTFQTATAFALGGLAHAAETLVGAAIGARDEHALGQAVRISTLWAVLLAGLLSLVYAVGGEAFVGMLTDQQAVKSVALQSLGWAILMPLASVLAFQFDGVFLGALQARALMRSMLLCVALFFVASPLLQASFGNQGLWASLMLFMTLRGMTLAWLLPRVVMARANCQPIH